MKYKRPAQLSNIYCSIMPKQTNYWAKTATDEANLSSVLQSHDCPFEGSYKIKIKDLRGLKESVPEWKDIKT